MIDLHSHLLPGIDDGSEDLQSSIAHLTLMEKSGISDVFLTSHMMKGTFDNDNKILTEKYNLLKNAVSHLKINLHLGAECYLYENLVEDIINEDLFLGNSKYVLFETSLADNNFLPEFYDVTYKMLLNGMKPVLAHPERYRPIMENPGLAEDLISRNIYLQLNAGSLLGDYGKYPQQAAWELLHKGHVHFLGSDTHCRKDYYPYKMAVDVIRKEIDDYTADLLSIHNPKKILKDEKVDFVYLEETIVNKNKSFLKKILNGIFNKNG